MAGHRLQPAWQLVFDEFVQTSFAGSAVRGCVLVLRSGNWKLRKLGNTERGPENTDKFSPVSDKNSFDAAIAINPLDLM
jgi:hypothetical protein